MLHTSQKLLNLENINELRLSPYVVFKDKGLGKLCLLRNDRRQFIMLEASDNNTLVYLLELLRKGITRNSLKTVLYTLEVDDPDSWINLCVEKGILE